MKKDNEILTPTPETDVVSDPKDDKTPLSASEAEEIANSKAERSRERLHNFFRILVAVLGAGLGSVIVLSVASIGLELSWGFDFSVWYYIGGALLFGIIFYFFSPRIIRNYMALVRAIETWLNGIPMIEIVFGSVGLVIGLIIAFLLSALLQQFPFPPTLIAILSTALYVLFGILGWSIGRKRRGEIKIGSISDSKAAKGAKGKKDKADIARPKILDTSVIIDGRIFDICKTGILEGRLVIPGFVLQELRHVSDSADSLKRTRGRRGLDILNKIQKELDMYVEVNETDYDDIAEVDAKLLRLAVDIEGVVLTNDFNLNKVAAVQRVPVLNINELANAVKPVVLPGEEMRVTIIKDGKEYNQGVAYLDDGTMIVVDGGRNMAGQTRDVTVTSVLQTSAGRMIFAKLK